VANLSNETLNIASIYSTDPVVTIQPISTVLQAGERKKMLVSFSPTDQKIYNTSIVFLSASNTSPDTLFFNGAGQAPSFLSIQSRTISFGTVSIGSYKEATINFYNLGFDTLHIYHIYSNDSNFTASNSLLPLAENQSGSFIIRFSPKVAGNINSQIIIESNSLHSPDTVYINGNGKLAYCLESVSRKVTFDASPVNQYKEASLDLKNIGVDTLRFYKIYSTNNNFSVTLSQNTIAGGGSCQLIIRFAPVSTGFFGGLIILESNSLYSPDTIQVYGSGGIENKEGIPSSFYLQQSYPNPFNSIMSIPFGLPFPSQTVITIFNNQGQLIETIMDNYLKEGRYELKWHPTRLASGVYFYRISAGSFVAAKKLILLK
jgi:hypothetical protein